MQVCLRKDQTEAVVNLTVEGRQYEALVDTGFGGLLLAFAYPDSLYNARTFLNNVRLSAPIRLLPKSQWSVVADARSVPTWTSAVPLHVGKTALVSEMLVIYADKRQKQDLIMGMRFLRDHMLRLCLDFKHHRFLLA